MKIQLSIFLFVLLCLGGCKTNKSATSTGDLPLQGTRWNLVSIEGQELETNKYPVQVKPYIIFDTAGQYNGNLGCNIFFGTYYQKRQKIEIEYGSATKRLCPNMEIEKIVMGAIRKDINNFVIEGKNLTLYSGKKEIMKFEGVEK
jgi:heat shock protein HslJ